MKIVKGSEIVHQICCVECKTSNPDPCPESCLKYQQALLGKIVVPSETWVEREVIIDVLRLEIKHREEEMQKIKSLIETLTCASMRAESKGCIHYSCPFHRYTELELPSACSIYDVVRLREFKERTR